MPFMAVSHAVEDPLLVWRQLEVAVNYVLFRDVTSRFLDHHERLLLVDRVAGENVAVREGTKTFVGSDVLECEEIEFVAILCAICQSYLYVSRDLRVSRPALRLFFDSTDLCHACGVDGAARACASSARRALAFAFFPAMVVLLAAMLRVAERFSVEQVR